MTWANVRTLLNSMIFDLGYQEVHRRTMLGVGTIYRLANDEVKTPNPRTIRDLEVAIAEWQEAAFSQMERSMAGEDDATGR